MASNDPPKKPAPPAAFLLAQTRIRKRKTRSHGSNASTVSHETDADDESMLVAAETLSNVNEHESRTMEPDRFPQKSAHILSLNKSLINKASPRTT
ncbi:hypothetical protein NM208_g10628 [Fusarium decemcellulare]|uniref:Uncharacterized protein n=1 Tax=Fusarium decemcellulare TaxID=57161 RepID=A0ACC1RXD8_9HYPO|nr:hypothetical protein NM208_g10628 [Fusarium decemcellulare]